ncbi:MAG: hypothetical protein FWF53_09250 [Candidatus Azobacteroides sp.]|nr:hypothetical protein [Candidatus Azobacteroides sp.]
MTLLQSELHEPVVQVAKGISEYGFMAIVSAFYLIITGIMMVFFIKWFVKIIDGIVKGQEKSLGEVVTLQREMVLMMKSINDGINDETLTQIKLFITAIIENSKYKMYHEAKKIYEENNLEKNRESIEKKVSNLVKNMYDSHEQKYDSFSYKGKKLFLYTNSSWVDKIAETVLNSIYMDNYSHTKLFTNLTIAYEEIINDFIKNLSR